MGLEFHVEKGCFIPRDTTEGLINIITDDINEKYKNENVKILEIGGGSGAVAISIAEFSENVEIDILEKEKIPQNVIEKNTEKYELTNNINLIKEDYFEYSDLDYEKYDIIVSNPPYISEKEKNDLDKEVLDYEPHESLFGGEDGLDFYRKFVKEIDKFKKDTFIYLEFGYNQKKDIKNIFSRWQTEFFKDIDKIDRFVKIKK
jgi:release factor glutamine methyltransferase